MKKIGSREYTNNTETGKKPARLKLNQVWDDTSGDSTMTSVPRMIGWRRHW